jgi:hypothetical protein
MTRSETLLAGFLVFLVAAAPVFAEQVEPRGLGDPGVLNTLRVEPEAAEGQAALVIRGRDARQQLVVTGEYSSGQSRDHTHSAKYTVEPAGIIEIAADGMVTPLKDGDASVKVVDGGKEIKVVVHVEGVANEIRINFKNQIVPIFTKLGCNSGGCHGKASGQNGFKLSLLGFYPDDDFEFLVKEARGRRLFPTSPADSLLLMKATGKSPHGGGKRMEEGSYEYRMLHRWVEQGMPYGNPEDPYVVGIQCVPAQRVMDRGADQQITVVAEYSDGTTEDVTRMALYEANDTEMAESTETAIIKTLDLAGEVAIMARYQGQVSTFRATIPLGADTSSVPAPANFIDEAVFAKLKLLGIPPSALCDDATFLRRVHIDVTGTTPTQEQVQAFLDDPSTDKREKLVDRLLDTEAYADYFANKWNLVLRNKKRRAEDLTATYAFYRWIWDSLYENKPYDEFVRDVVTASGESTTNPAVVWYREVDQVNEQVEDTAQLFLGREFNVLGVTIIHSKNGARTTTTDSLHSSRPWPRRTLTESSRLRPTNAFSTTKRSLRLRILARRKTSSPQGWVAPHWRFRPNVIPGIISPTGCLARTTRSSPGLWSIDTGSTSLIEASLSRKTTCGKPTRRRILNCWMDWLRTSSRVDSI